MSTQRLAARLTTVDSSDAQEATRQRVRRLTIRETTRYTYRTDDRKDDRLGELFVDTGAYLRVLRRRRRLGAGDEEAA